VRQASQPRAEPAFRGARNRSTDAPKQRLSNEAAGPRSSVSLSLDDDAFFVRFGSSHNGDSLPLIGAKPGAATCKRFPSDLSLLLPMRATTCTSEGDARGERTV